MHRQLIGDDTKTKFPDLLYNSVCLISQATKKFDQGAGPKKTQ